jgi:inositol transport system permease protein
MANVTATAKGTGGRGFDIIGFMEKYGVLLFLVLLILLFTAYNPRFLSARNITNILTEVSIYGIIGVGMTSWAAISCWPGWWRC